MALNFDSKPAHLPRAFIGYFSKKCCKCPTVGPAQEYKTPGTSRRLQTPDSWDMVKNLILMIADGNRSLLKILIE